MRSYFDGDPFPSTATSIDPAAPVSPSTAVGYRSAQPSLSREHSLVFDLLKRNHVGEQRTDGRREGVCAQSRWLSRRSKSPLALASRVWTIEKQVRVGVTARSEVGESRIVGGAFGLSRSVTDSVDPSIQKRLRQKGC